MTRARGSFAAACVASIALVAACGGAVHSAGYYVENQALVVTNAVNLFPQPVGDLGVLRNVLRAWQTPEG